MKKPVAQVAAGKPALSRAQAPGSGPGLPELFDRLERMVDEAVAVVGRLGAENRELTQQLAESERRRKAAVLRLDVLLEGIESAKRVPAGPGAG